MSRFHKKWSSEASLGSRCMWFMLHKNQRWKKFKIRIFMPSSFHILLWTFHASSDSSCSVAFGSWQKQTKTQQKIFRRSAQKKFMWWKIRVYDNTLRHEAISWCISRTSSGFDVPRVAEDIHKEEFVYFTTKKNSITKIYKMLNNVESCSNKYERATKKKQSSSCHNKTFFLVENFPHLRV